MKKAVILCSGVWTEGVPREIFEDALIICADGGMDYAESVNITPHIIIGDGDSAQKEYPDAIPHITYPAEKDETDTALCLEYAIKNGCDEVTVIGGLGGRLDHEYANISLLLYGLNRGVQVRLLNETNELFIKNRPFCLERNDKKYISFFPFGGDVCGLTIKGLKYNAEGITLTGEMPLACCNEFAKEDAAQISFDKGNLLVIRSND